MSCPNLVTSNHIHLFTYTSTGISLVNGLPSEMSGNLVHYCGFYLSKCLPEEEGWCAVSLLQSASGAPEWYMWTTPHSLATVVMAYSANDIQQLILYNSTLQTVLTQKSNALEVHILMFPHPSLGNV